MAAISASFAPQFFFNAFAIANIKQRPNPVGHVSFLIKNRFRPAPPHGELPHPDAQFADLPDRVCLSGGALSAVGDQSTNRPGE